ncbi:flagellar assembly protein FliW, partial [bacterium]|nr:flagellar assembly protein FliW [bacterium]
QIRLAIINPLVFKPEYAPKISKAEIDILKIEDKADLLTYVIVTLRNPLNESTANLMGPLFVNIKSKIGRQIIIEDDAYSLREKIIT